MTDIASRVEELILLHDDTWSDRGYGIKMDDAGMPLIHGDLGQFYADAVANDAHAAEGLAVILEADGAQAVWLYERAADDGIDMAETVRTFTSGPRPD